MANSDESSRSFSFPAMEREILGRWEEEDTFQESLRRTANAKPYVFFDGPPFATGLPHHGNLLASVIKDVVGRFWTMQGRYVERRFGWDCHGLPIEHEIDKQLGLSAHAALEKLGVAGYNRACRGIVDRYVDQWRTIINRFGRWVDFDNQYQTMNVWFMESVWWVVKQLWDKDLIYRGNKVMPVSTALETPLSNFEATSNYLSVQDPSITVIFKLVDEDAYMMAWTTTPWTLPSNLALCVGNEIEYVLVRDAETDRFYYLAADRLEYYQTQLSLSVVRTMQGVDLVGKRYVPIFSYFAHFAEQDAFQVFADDYVNTEEGTGIVHQAPAFGEDDLRIASAHGLEPFVCPVSMNGNFTEEVVDFAGQFVKDADSDIIDWLKEHGSLLHQATIQHNYPYCYRSNTPLIYRAVPSWFVRVSAFREQLVRANKEVDWVPEHIRDGRFGNWLENALDWAISRNRVWGTPLPIWENETTGNFICIGSREELANYTGTTVVDLHREHVDELRFAVEGEDGEYVRVPQILDCWFESGAMPYAQQHYPFENKEKFENGFPADFIAEGLDQTRGWFYTLMVLSTALFDKPAFRNVIVNGMVLAEDGKKMSKSLKNYTDPQDLMEKYGSDALRLYLMSSSLMRGEEQRFVDSGVQSIVRRALLPWYNAFHFLQLYAGVDEWTSASVNLASSNILDRWLLSRLQSFKREVENELKHYRLYNLAPNLYSFLSDLKDWYIRLNRSRFWASGMSADKTAAYTALYSAVLDLAKVMAPSTPFLADHIFRELAVLDTSSDRESSVHLVRFPSPDPALVDAGLEHAVQTMQKVIMLGRRKREEERINLRTPLPALTVIHRDERVLEQLRDLETYLKAELNVKKVSYDANEAAFISHSAKPNFPVLGKRLGRRMREFQRLFDDLTANEMHELQKEGNLVVNGETFTSDEIDIRREAKEGTDVLTDRAISIQLDCTTTDDLLLEGLAREIVHTIQLARRELDFEVTDRVEIAYNGSQRVRTAIDRFADYVSQETLAEELRLDDPAGFTESFDGEELRFDLTRVA